MGSHTSEAVKYAERVSEFQTRPAWDYEAWKLLGHVEKESCRFTGLVGLKVLDFGCGPGKLCRMASMKGAVAVGVDTSYEMIARAEYYRRRFPGGQVIHERMDRFVPVHLGDFDLIFCMHVLGHVPNVVETLIHLRSRLTKNGRVVILNPNKTHTSLRKPYNWLRGFKADPTIKHRFTHSDLEHLAGVANLRVEWSYMTGEKFLGVHSLIAASFVKA